MMEIKEIRKLTAELGLVEEDFIQSQNIAIFNSKDKVKYSICCETKEVNICNKEENQEKTVEKFDSLSALRILLTMNMNSNPSGREESKQGSNPANMHATRDESVHNLNTPEINAEEEFNGQRMGVVHSLGNSHIPKQNWKSETGQKEDQKSHGNEEQLYEMSEKKISEKNSLDKVKPKTRTEYERNPSSHFIEKNQNLGGDSVPEELCEKPLKSNLDTESISDHDTENEKQNGVYTCSLEENNSKTLPEISVLSNKVAENKVSSTIVTRSSLREKILIVNNLNTKECESSHSKKPPPLSPRTLSTRNSSKIHDQDTSSDGVSPRYSKRLLRRWKNDGDSRHSSYDARAPWNVEDVRKILTKANFTELSFKPRNKLLSFGNVSTGVNYLVYYSTGTIKSNFDPETGSLLVGAQKCLKNQTLSTLEALLSINPNEEDYNENHSVEHSEDEIEPNNDPPWKVQDVRCLAKKYNLTETASSERAKSLSVEDRERKMKFVVYYTSGTIGTSLNEADSRCNDGKIKLFLYNQKFSDLEGLFKTKMQNESENFIATHAPWKLEHVRRLAAHYNLIETAWSNKAKIISFVSEKTGVRYSIYYSTGSIKMSMRENKNAERAKSFLPNLTFPKIEKLIKEQEKNEKDRDLIPWKLTDVKDLIKQTGFIETLSNEYCKCISFKSLYNDDIRYTVYYSTGRVGKKGPNTRFDYFDFVDRLSALEKMLRDVGNKARKKSEKNAGYLPWKLEDVCRFAADSGSSEVSRNEKLRVITFQNDKQKKRYTIYYGTGKVSARPIQLGSSIMHYKRYNKLITLKKILEGEEMEEEGEAGNEGETSDGSDFEDGQSLEKSSVQTRSTIKDKNGVCTAVKKPVQIIMNLTQLEKEVEHTTPEIFVIDNEEKSNSQIAEEREAPWDIENVRELARAYNLEEQEESMELSKGILCFDNLSHSKRFYVYYLNGTIKAFCLTTRERSFIRRFQNFSNLRDIFMNGVPTVELNKLEKRSTVAPLPIKSEKLLVSTEIKNLPNNRRSTRSSKQGDSSNMSSSNKQKESIESKSGTIQRQSGMKVIFSGVTTRAAKRAKHSDKEKTEKNAETIAETLDKAFSLVTAAHIEKRPNAHQRKADPSKRKLNNSENFGSEKQLSSLHAASTKKSKRDTKLPEDILDENISNSIHITDKRIAQPNYLQKVHDDEKTKTRMTTRYSKRQQMKVTEELPKQSRLGYKPSMISQSNKSYEQENPLYQNSGFKSNYLDSENILPLSKLDTKNLSQKFEDEISSVNKDNASLISTSLNRQGSNASVSDSKKNIFEPKSFDVNHFSRRKIHLESPEKRRNSEPSNRQVVRGDRKADFDHLEEPLQHAMRKEFTPERKEGRKKPDDYTRAKPQLWGEVQPTWRKRTEIHLEQKKPSQSSVYLSPNHFKAKLCGQKPDNKHSLAPSLPRKAKNSDEPPWRIGIVRSIAEAADLKEISCNLETGVLTFSNDDNWIQYIVYYLTGTIALKDQDSGDILLYRCKQTLKDLKKLFGVEDDFEPVLRSTPVTLRSESDGQDRKKEDNSEINLRNLLTLAREIGLRETDINKEMQVITLQNEDNRAKHVVYYNTGTVKTSSVDSVYGKIHVLRRYQSLDDLKKLLTEDYHTTVQEYSSKRMFNRSHMES